MPQPAIAEAETVIIGAGIVGCALAFHLARMGHRDVLVLDRGAGLLEPLGSTGHAPGLLCRNSPSPAMSAMADHTAELLSELPLGNPAMTRVGSLEVTRDPGRAAEMQRKLRTAAANGLEARAVSPQEIGALVPYLDAGRLAGGVFVEGDGGVDVRRALRALHDEAAGLGAGFRWGTDALGFVTDGSRVTGVTTTGGTVACRRAVVAVGIWGRVLAGTLGIDLPIVPVQHPYLTTAPLPFLAGAAAEVSRPIVRDLDRMFYLREHEDRLGFGWYNHGPRDCDVRALRRADMPYPERGFDEAVDHGLFPALRDAPIAHRLNGIFSMTPDGGPLLGEVPGRPGLWVAEAVWITHAVGAARSVAELILGRQPGTDVSRFGPMRFGSQNVEKGRQESLRLYNSIYAWPTELTDAA